MAIDPEPAGLAAPILTDRQVALSGNALGMASMMAWAAGFPAAEILLDTWPPLALITARFLMAVGILIPVWAMTDGLAVLRRARWGRGTWVGSISFGFGAWLLLLAQSLTDPVTVALIASATPIAATLLELAQRTRRLSRNFGFGLAASVIGGVVATSGASPAHLGIGAACAIVSVFLFSWGSLMTVRDFPELSPIGRTTVTLAGGMLAMCLVALAASAIGIDVLPRVRVTPDQFGLLMIYALAGMALSQVMWIASVGRLGVAVASFHINVAPFYVMLLMLALGGGWNWTQLAGAAIVALGVVLSQRRGG